MTTTLWRYYEILERLNLGPLFRKVVETNGSNTLPYHNLEHLIQMIEDVYMLACHHQWLKDDAWSKGVKALVIAAMWHDFDHSGGTTSDMENVKRADDAFWAQYNSRPELFGDVDPSDVSELIRCTQFPYVWPRKEELSWRQQIIRDADMLAAYRETAFSHVLYGLHRELGASLSHVILKNPDFLESIPMNTAKGKQLKDMLLPKLRAECQALLRLWGE